MSLNTPKPQGQKFPNKIYKYVGPQKELNNLWFQRIAEFEPDKDGKPSKNKWPNASDEWKFGFGQETVFLTTIERNDLQPPPLQKLFCSIIETPETVEVGNQGVGGFIYSASLEEFKRDFQEKGSQ